MSEVQGHSSQGSTLGQIVEKPQGLSGKSSPRGGSEPRDVPKANTRAQSKGLPSEYPEAFRLPRGGTFSRYHQRLFHNLSDFGFLEVQGHSSQGSTLGQSVEKRQGLSGKS